MKYVGLKYICVIALMLVATTALFGQKRYEGYSLTVEAGNDGACPVRYLPGVGGGNTISVYLAGTEQRTAATGLIACDGSRVDGNQVASNDIGRWCFQGAEDLYDIKLKTGVTYLWYPVTRETGFYNVKDFRPVTRTGGATPQYTFTEPSDYSKTIKNAVAFIAARQGGTLRFPDGDYVVGTTDGNTRDPSYTGITLPSGTTIEGAGSNASIPTTNQATRNSVTRIRLKNENQAIFRIGGCTNQVVVRGIELLGNSAGFRETPRSTVGNYGIEALGKWEIDPSSGAQAPNSSQFFRFENVTFQNLDKGIYVHNVNDQNCNAREQACGSWQFDYVRVDHGVFLNNKSGIWVDTYNTDWKITNSVFNYTAANAPGDGIHIGKAGTMLIEQTWGGGYDYERHIGGTFVWIGTIQTLTILNSGSERGQRSIYMHPLGAMSSLMINVIGSVFDDKIELNGRVNYISSGSYYGPRTIQADPSVMVTSTGDRFCYDPAVLPGRCKDERGAMVSNPGFGNARAMFKTGRPPEGSGPNRIERQPNFFGYDVEIADNDPNNNEPLLSSRSKNSKKPLLRLGEPANFYDFRRLYHNGFLSITGNQQKPYNGITLSGPIQFDPNITFSDITTYASTAFVPGQPVITDGAFLYCKDCKKNETGICTQGRAGTDGAFAKRINNQWRCD